MKLLQSINLYYIFISLQAVDVNAKQVSDPTPSPVLVSQQKVVVPPNPPPDSSSKESPSKVNCMNYY